MSIKDFYVMLFGEFNPYDFNMYFGEMLSANEAETRQLERRIAAYMAYVYISQVRNEPDEPSIEPAMVLKDIYECSSCLRYIAQVYLKGIMQSENGVFGVRRIVGDDEAVQIAERVLNRSKRSVSGQNYYN